MRVNIYAEELTDLVEVIQKTTDGGTFTGLRIYLQLPVTTTAVVQDMEAAAEGILTVKEVMKQTRGPFLHAPGDDDSSAVTFWGKRDLRTVLHVMMEKLNQHYGEKHPEKDMWSEQAGAWRKICDTLTDFNPTCFSRPLSGTECAVLEIKQLQAKKIEVQRLRSLIANHQHGYCDTPSKLCELCDRYESHHIHNVGAES
jgi:hypothetical protein